MNEYDSARLLDMLKESHGVTLVDQAEHADLLLLNTCSIREKAQEKVFAASFHDGEVSLTGVGMGLWQVIKLFYFGKTDIYHRR